jgi:GntR family transcriptional regulator, galactonate operon transcriptional repressor
LTQTSVSRERAPPPQEAQERAESELEPPRRRGPSAGKSSSRGNANDFLAAALGGEIIAGLYPPGSRLPGEAVLLQRFGGSRPTMREAFRVLAAKGLIVSRQKVGTSVRPKSDWNMLDPDFLAWHLRTALTKDFVNDLFQLRQMVEPQAAYLAAQSRDPAALERISAAYADMERASSVSDDVTDADLRFHQAILDATGNLFIGALGGLIDTALVGTFKLGWRAAASIRDNRLHQHRSVLKAISEGRPETARDRMAELLQDSVADVRREMDVSGISKTPAIASSDKA